ncbi:hypothetical protein HTZ77_28970 [Nonomuraea sp. SMC257]|uniref:Uncharacterized protein n=1 Tax=Nonomuraea montanisoli TaxID=2741721 RepID=A0A7Y6M543_9ACTN|nr:hypothetical protein [Nonomuraea montanisoli]NUW35433.1 hypothetical protein [Nonomuraea montanisoli]
MAFPDWSPRPEEWVSLRTLLEIEGDGAGVTVTTEVILYLGHTRVRARRYRGEEARRFWLELMKRTSS